MWTAIAYQHIYSAIALEQSIFISCGEGDRNLSTNYMATLKTILGTKRLM
ncbi:hypothetical protein [Phormidium tenue]|uniref:Uncharacterized protein n=1 Tax=Phormidium tenue FACHB-1050 TaxID=2692857 RepID=A0ABR8CDT3_9CYAN|nr:hypothetical protein [Phormidium tenue]MBD2318270.1 hypothetical protein [Phormidium tenue FACHB-1050]